MTGEHFFQLDEDGEQRRARWLELFVNDPAGVAPANRSPADAVLDSMFEHYGDLWNERIAPFFADLYAATGLSRKTVELIALAALAVRGWETGVRAHARLALDSGATAQEIRGAILVVLGIGGIAAAASGLAWVEPILGEDPGNEPLEVSDDPPGST